MRAVIATAVIILVLASCGCLGYQAIPAAVPVPGHPTTQSLSSGDAVINRTYEWDYNHSKYLVNLSIPESLYDYFLDQPRTGVSGYAGYATSGDAKPYVGMLADDIRELADAQGLSDGETLLLTIAMVQSLPYTSNKETTGFDEYPRYPIETLVDRGGDCEDTAILAAALARELGYRVVLLIFNGSDGSPGHMAIGIHCSGDLKGTYYTYKGDRYYYLETTGSGWRIGDAPEKYRGAKARVYPVA